MQTQPVLRRLSSWCAVGIIALASPAAGGEPVSPVFVDSGQSLGSSASRAVALGDLDGDGDIDAFVANYSSGNAVWLNNGLGIFSDSAQVLGAGVTTDIALVDVDGDSDLDAFTVNGTGPDKVWLNNGTGVFSDSGQSLGNTESLSVSLGDFDGDNDPDALVTHRDSGAPAYSLATVWTNDGAGLFVGVLQSSISSGHNPEAAVGDLDGDEDLDALVTMGHTGGDNQLWLNDGDGALSSAGAVAGANCRRVALGDLDGDGDLDAFLVAADPSMSAPSRVIRNDGAAVFTDTGQTLGAVNSNAAGLGDFDRDGDLDAFVATWAGNRVWSNDGVGFFIDTGQTLGSSESSNVALADLDGDGDLDAFVTTDGANTVWMNATILSLFSDGFEVGDPSMWTRASPPVLAVTSVHPDNGLASGGDLITITGSGFIGATDIHLGGVSCVTWSILDTGHAQCETPSHTPASVRVTVWKDRGLGSLADGFRFTGDSMTGMDWVGLDSPASAVCTAESTTETMIGWCHGVGFTDWNGPPTASVVAEVGWGPVGSLPGVAPGWKWFEATWSSDASAEIDAFQVAPICPVAGTYAVAFRCSADNGLHYQYGDLYPGSSDGINPADLGQLISHP